MLKFSDTKRWESRQLAMKKLDAMLQARLKFNSKEPAKPAPVKSINLPVLQVTSEIPDDLPPPPLPKSLPPEPDCLDLTLPDDLPLPPPPAFEEEKYQTSTRENPSRKNFTRTRILPPSPDPLDKENNNILNKKTTTAIIHARDDKAPPVCCVCETKIVR